MDRQHRNGSLRGAPSHLFVAALVLSVVCGASAAPGFGSVEAGAAAAKPLAGKYKGKTSQASVESSFRRIVFRVKGRQITLVTEPVVRHGDCLTPPVFIEEEGQVVKTRINAKGTFSFVRTFIGSKMDRIKGTFVDERTIEGTATYHFDDSASGQCAAGKESPTFRAGR